MPEMESTLVCVRKAHLALTRAFLQPAATATMYCHPEVCTHPPPPVPHFLLAQNLSSKRFVPTDNMRPKSDDTKKRHRFNSLTYTFSESVYSRLQVYITQWANKSKHLAIGLFRENFLSRTSESFRADKWSWMYVNSLPLIFADFSTGSWVF